MALGIYIAGGQPMSIVATPPGQANDMRFVWLLNSFYETPATRMARDILFGAVYGAPVRHRTAARLLGHLQVDPLKVLRLLEQDSDAIPGNHLLIEGFVSLADFYGLLEMALRLNLVPWPLRQTFKNETIQFLAQERFSYFFRERYKIALIPDLQMRLHSNLKPPSEEASSQETYAFNALLSTHSHLSTDRALRTFLFSEFGSRRRETISRSREERLLGLTNKLDFPTMQDGFWRFLSAIREMTELKFISANTRMPALINSFYNPWIEFLEKNQTNILDIAQAEIQAEFETDDLDAPVHAALKEAVRTEYSEILSHWVRPHKDLPKTRSAPNTGTPPKRSITPRPPDDNAQGA